MREYITETTQEPVFIKDEKEEEHLPMENEHFTENSVHQGKGTENEERFEQVQSTRGVFMYIALVSMTADSYLSVSSSS